MFPTFKGYITNSFYLNGSVFIHELPKTIESQPQNVTVFFLAVISA